MIFDNKIRCECIAIQGEREICPGGIVKRGEVYEVHRLTPNPPMCLRAFLALYTNIIAMRASDETFWEKNRKQDYLDLVCPDGLVTFRVSRVG